MEAINRGRVSRYLTKPFEDAELLDALHSAIDLVYLQRSVRSLELRVLRSGPPTAAHLANLELAEELERNGALIASSLGEASDLVAAAQNLAGPDGHLRALLDGARTSQDLALQTVAQLRALIDRRPRGGSPRPASAPRCVVARAVETVVRTLRPEVGKFSKVQVQLDGEPVAAIDPTAFAQVLTHLVVNAAQAVGTEGGDPALIVVRVAATDSEAVVSVSDSGAGINPDDQQRIFDPFFSTRRRDGLGLAVARELVAAAGGSIGVESAPGQGSTFIVRLPLRKS
jgi:signal transduction histidine kinase